MALTPGGQPRRLLAIGLDAAEPDLIERWIADGTLPNLRRLRRSGTYRRLASSAAWLSGSPWPTFYTSRPPQDHGLYHNQQWHSGRMTTIRPNAEWLPARPFWRDLGAQGCRVVVLDIPQTYAPEPFDGVEISGWAAHDRLAPPSTHPAALSDWLRREFGTSAITDEKPGPQSPRALVTLREELLRATNEAARLAERLMLEQPWDLFLMAFGATHRAGHRLWNLSSVRGQPSERDAEVLSAALHDTYVACDRALGRLVEAAGADVDVLVFSLHGMGPNTSRNEVLPSLLARVLNDGEPKGAPTSPDKSVLAALRRQVPLAWRNTLTRRLPIATQDRLSRFWRLSGIDWSTTRAISLFADLQGYIRINCAGREALGTVEPGAAFDALCREIAAGLESFVDADTAEPVMSVVARTDRVLPSGERSEVLPDLVVRWADTPAARHRTLHSPRFGTVPWPTPGRNPDGRSGNHRFQGFLLAAGPAFGEGAELPEADIVDLAPTIVTLLGLQPEKGWAGKPL